MFKILDTPTTSRSPVWTACHATTTRWPRRFQHPDAILVRSHNMHEMPIPQTLKAIGRAGAGVNNIPVDRMSTHGIVVFNAPGANANAVKELVLAGMLLAARNNLPGVGLRARSPRHGCRDPKGRRGRQEAVRRLRAARPGPRVIGLGAIGVKVANAAIALGMRVIASTPTSP